MKIFLSHTKDDKKEVRRIHDILKSHGHDLWLDENKILAGGSILEGISSGLEHSDIVIVFLSEKSISSTWVKTEWHTFFFDRVNKGGVYIIPLLLEHCDVPLLLRDKKLVDFSNKEEYETNIANLLRDLQIIEYKANEKQSTDLGSESVLEYTKELLDELEDEFISFPVGSRKIPLIDSLKKIKRSGKKVRLARMRPALQTRSLYDHVLSVAHSADCLLPYFDHGLSANHHTELARIIAFHEVNEVVLGDIPSYTNLSNSKRNSTRTYAERNLRSVPPPDRERIANEFIWLFLSEKQRQSMTTVLEYLNNHQSPLTVFFKFLDKTDPIIAIWRYLHHYRGKLGSSADDFFRKMRDFFENPNIRSYVINNTNKDEFLYLVDTLQNRALAKKYYRNKKCCFNKRQTGNIPTSVFIDLIEKCPLFYLAKTEGEK